MQARCCRNQTRQQEEVAGRGRQEARAGCESRTIQFWLFLLAGFRSLEVLCRLSYVFYRLPTTDYGVPTAYCPLSVTSPE